MASLSLRGIYKKYPGGVVAVSDVNLEIKDKEFIILVDAAGTQEELLADSPLYRQMWETHMAVKEGA